MSAWSEGEPKGQSPTKHKDILPALFLGGVLIWAHTSVQVAAGSNADQTGLLCALGLRL